MSTRPTASNPPPRFLWQGLLILLPVAVLAVFGLASLKRDAQAAEQEEQRRAVQAVQALAQAVRSSVSEDLERFLIAQNEWMLEMYSASQPTVTMTFPDEILKTDLGKWERSYPELKVAPLATPQSDLLVNGSTGGGESKPPDISAVPVPPKWYLDLTSKQQELWAALRQVETARSGQVQLTPTAGSALQAFLNTHPSEEARQAAAYVADPPEWLVNFDSPLPTTESGLPLQDLACYRLLATNSPPASNSVLEAVWKRVIEHPSFAAPTLLGMAQRLTNGADARVCTQVHWMNEYWQAQCRARDWLAPLSQLPGLSSNWGSPLWSSWTTADSGRALAIFTSCTFRGGGHDDKGYFIWFFPEPVVKAVFARALADNRSLIPAYADVALTVQGSPLLSTGIAAASSHEPPMANAELPFGQAAVYHGATFELSFYLTNRQLMLSAARTRALRFGWLITVAVAVSLIGFFAARRAFYRQLRLNEMKSDFVSSVSHELRAPIASVRLMAEGLERGRIAESDKQREYFKFIVQECRRLSSLIENVLDFSRIEQGRKQYEPESTDLAALTQQTVKVMETYAAERNVGLSLRVTGETAPVNADGKAIQQALVNLIDNAIKHSPKGGEVVVGLEFTLPRVSIWVEDHGEGIAESEHEKIFERFYRVGSELRRETQGVGIGLSIVKHIVEAHNGRVTVRSIPGQGSRFTIELPVGNESNL